MARSPLQRAQEKGALPTAAPRVGEGLAPLALVTWEWGGRGKTWVVRSVPGREILLTAATCREAVRRAENAGLDVVGPYRPRRSRRARPRQLSFPFY